MDTGFAIVKGIVQGLTEFLPVSSTGHLILTETLIERYGWFIGPDNLTEAEAFDVLLHMGTLGALFAYFWRDVLGWISNPLKNRTLHLLLISLAVTSVLVLSIMQCSELVFASMGWAQKLGVKDLSEFYRSDFRWIAFHLTLTGLMLFWIEFRQARQSRAQQSPTPQNQSFTPEQIATMPVKNAIVVGLFQTCAATFHGISRAGSTITGGMLCGLSRVAATRYGFMLGIPTFMAAALYEGVKVAKHASLSELPWTPMLIGTLVSAVVGYICVRLFVGFVARFSLKPFAYYCWAVVLLMLWVL
ncbi:MAG: undecaprenyl-diphosphate phosphatase [Vampirovibrionales bacterium]|nr:undecaprenyl-diphosphate phosphatase [Vampirovibrionales bacterium]